MIFKHVNSGTILKFNVRETCFRSNNKTSTLDLVTTSESFKMSRKCFYYISLGHVERKCQTKKASRENQYNRGQRGCHKCNEASHTARNCNEKMTNLRVEMIR